MVAATAITAVLGQYQRPESANYAQEEYPEYEQPRPAHPTPRSYGTGSPSSERQQAAAAAPKPTPVAILKQINRHNEDGSYTYGFEGGDGSFKIETKLANGEVKGKYGFVDDTGKVRVVEYGANQYGFQPAGEGITVAPPTLIDETTNKDGMQNANYDYDYQQPAAARPAPQRAVAQPVVPQSSPRQQQYQQARYEQAPLQSHTQAIYNPQLAGGREASAPKPAAFAPAQSQLLRSSYDEPAPASQAYNQGPVQFSPAPVQERAQPAQTRGQPSGGILDQLARDYALPQGGSAPLHDISFGYY